jgi:TonB family protein
MKSRNDLPDLAHRLILRAAQRAPAALTERLTEEWLADLEYRTGLMARLRLAMGCYWATAVIARDFGTPQLATSGIATGHKPFLDILPNDWPRLSSRAVAFILIAGLQVLLLYGFASAFRQHVVTTPPTSTHAYILDETNPQRPIPRSVAPNFKPTLIPPSVLGPPDPQKIQFTVNDGDIAQATPQAPSGPASPVVPRAIHRVWGGPDEGFPNTDDYYPAMSRRLAETGTTNVHVCVDPQGRLTADPALVQSSGSRSIDGAALKLAKAGSGHYRPTTEDGSPVSSCYSYRIRFELKN